MLNNQLKDHISPPSTRLSNTRQGIKARVFQITHSDSSLYECDLAPQTPKKKTLVLRQRRPRAKLLGAKFKESPLPCLRLALRKGRTDARGHRMVMITLLPNVGPQHRQPRRLLLITQQTPSLLQHRAYLIRASDQPLPELNRR